MRTTDYAKSNNAAYRWLYLHGNVEWCSNTVSGHYEITVRLYRTIWTPTFRRPTRVSLHSFPFPCFTFSTFPSPMSPRLHWNTHNSFNTHNARHIQWAVQTVAFTDHPVYRSCCWCDKMEAHILQVVTEYLERLRSTQVFIWTWDVLWWRCAEQAIFLLPTVRPSNGQLVRERNWAASE